MTGKIFINYRRDDAGNAAGRLYDRLEGHFGSDQLFIDVDKILGGLDFVEELNLRLAETDVMLAVIGRQWLTLKDHQTGERRLDNKADFVRKEIETALEAGIEIIPVLVDGADMPGTDDLPECLKPFSRRNAMRITLERFRSDAQGIIHSIEQAIERMAERREDTQKQQQNLAEEERTKKHELQLEAARNQALANLNPEQIITAEAVANWEFIKDSSEEENFRNHIARYQSHEASSKWARTRLEKLVWDGLEDEPEEADLLGFLDEFPDGTYAKDATAKLVHLRIEADKRQKQFERDLQEKSAWQFIKNTDDTELIEKFLNDFPNGHYTKEANFLIKTLTRQNDIWIKIVNGIGLMVLFFGIASATYLLLQKLGI